jgi:hypothetical protein
MLVHLDYVKIHDARNDKNVAFYSVDRYLYRR